MSGNQPPNTRSDFTRRAAMHPRVDFYAYPDHFPQVLVMMVIDEILVDKALLVNEPRVRAELSNYAIDTGKTVFDGFSHKPPDVEIWRLKPESPYRDAKSAVWAVRNAFHNVKPELVAPNHVLVPAQQSNYHTCPDGPPEPYDERRELQAADPNPGVVVTVIDSGYYPDGPIRARTQNARYGEWFMDTGGRLDWHPEGAAARMTPNGALGGLVGHANFVAGVIAQKCPVADIRVISHNGDFVYGAAQDDTVPTEAAVARSLWRASGVAPPAGEAAMPGASVINIGFAFPTLPAIPLREGEVPRPVPQSWTFRVVLDEMARRSGADRHIVVAPAGNQNEAVRQYPAAFADVVGIGSRGSWGQKSDFSNYGDWVKGYADGENVISTFIEAPGSVTTEEAEPGSDPPAHPPKSFSSGWATWSGTCFAAPEVAAQIAVGVAGGASPRQAWLDVQDQYAWLLGLSPRYWLRGLRYRLARRRR
jgi:thermitase